jgi:hypothetical protein
MSLYQEMKAQADKHEGTYPTDIVIRFKRWMMKNAEFLLNDHRTMDFEACTDANEIALRAYVATLPEFDFKWTVVNCSVKVSLKGHMSRGTFVA